MTNWKDLTRRKFGGNEYVSGDALRFLGVAGKEFLDERIESRWNRYRVDWRAHSLTTSQGVQRIHATPSGKRRAEQGVGKPADDKPDNGKGRQACAWSSLEFLYRLLKDVRWLALSCGFQCRGELCCRNLGDHHDRWWKRDIMERKWRDAGGRKSPRRWRPRRKCPNRIHTQKSRQYGHPKNTAGMSALVSISIQIHLVFLLCD